MSFLRRAAIPLAVLATAALAAIVILVVLGGDDEAGNANGKIYFEGDVQIFSIAPDGRDSPKVITPGQAAGSEPSVSADGTRIAYVRLLRANFDVWVMNSDGSDPTDLTGGPGGGSDDIDPAFAYDGSEIAFMSRRNAEVPDIYKMKPDGSSPVNLTPGTHGSSDTQPAFSPDGTRIAFTSDRAGEPDVWTMRRDGSGLQNLTAGPGLPANSGDPAYTPDAKRVVFVGDDALYSVDSGGGDLELISRAPKGGVYTGPAVSPDGTRIAVALARAGAEPSVVTVGIDDGEVKPLVTGFGTFSISPSWASIRGWTVER